MMAMSIPSRPLCCRATVAGCIQVSSSLLSCPAGLLGAVILDEAGQIKATLRFGRLHELLPHRLAAIVLRHEKCNAEVDADHVIIDPSRTGMKRVGEAIPFEHLAAVLLINGGDNF